MDIIAVAARRIALAVFGVVVSGGVASAHPVDEIVQGAYLTLTPDEVRLELDLTPGTAVAATILATIDSNGDAMISDAEAQAYGQMVLAQSRLGEDAVPLVLKLDQVVMPPYQTIALAGDVIKIMAVASRTDAVGTHQLSYRNDYNPVKSQPAANIFLQPANGWQYQVTGQQRPDDRTLSVDYTASQQ